MEHARGVPDSRRIPARLTRAGNSVGVMRVRVLQRPRTGGRHATRSPPHLPPPQAPEKSSARVARQARSPGTGSQYRKVLFPVGTSATVVHPPEDDGHGLKRA